MNVYPGCSAGLEHPVRRQPVLLHLCCSEHSADTSRTASGRLRFLQSSFWAIQPEVALEKTAIKKGPFYGQQAGRGTSW